MHSGDDSVLLWLLWLLWLLLLLLALPLPLLVPLLLPLKNLGSVATKGSLAAGAGCSAADIVTAGTELVSSTGGVSTAAAP